MFFPDLFLTTLYLHFLQLKDKGRSNIIPWFNTCLVVSLSGTFVTFLILKLIFDREGAFHIQKNMFLFFFFLIGLAYFFLIKQYYFLSGKYLLSCEKYQKLYTKKATVRLKILVFLSCVTAPLLLMFVVWYRAK